MNEVALSNRIRLFVLDITNTHTTSEIRDASKSSIKMVESKLGKIASALIGVTGIQKIIANAINRDQYFAEDFSDAVRWLLEQSKKI